MQTAKVQISSAQILALNATPVTLAAAPGAGKVLELIGFVWSGHFGTLAYAAGSAVDVQYHTSAVKAATAAVAAAVVNAAADHLQIQPNGGLDTPDDTPANLANLALELKASAAAFTTGDGTATVTVFYNTASLA